MTLLAIWLNQLLAERSLWREDLEEQLATSHRNIRELRAAL